MKVCLKNSICSLLLLVLCDGDGQSQFLINTIIQPPFIIEANKSDPDSRFGFKGILIDLLSEFLRKETTDVNFTFQVFDEYGRKQENGSWSGVVDQMINNTKTVFSLADFTVTSERMNVVQYSLPFLSTSGLSAIFKGIDFTMDENFLPKVLKLTQDNKISIGCQKDSIEHFFKYSEISIYQELYKQIKKNKENFVNSTEEGFRKVREASTDKPYVYFDEKAYLDYYAGKAPCDIKLTPCQLFNTAHYAILFSKLKSRDTIDHYNKIISDYLASGKMQISIEKWYRNECHDNMTIL